MSRILHSLVYLFIVNLCLYFIPWKFIIPFLPDSCFNSCVINFLNDKISPEVEDTTGSSSSNPTNGSPVNSESSDDTLSNGIESPLNSHASNNEPTNAQSPMMNSPGAPTNLSGASTSNLNAYATHFRNFVPIIRSVPGMEPHLAQALGIIMDFQHSPIIQSFFRGNIPMTITFTLGFI